MLAVTFIPITSLLGYLLCFLLQPTNIFSLEAHNMLHYFLPTMFVLIAIAL